MAIIGIDYSLTCPAVSVINPEDQSFQESSHFFLTDTKKYAGRWNNVIGLMHKHYTSEIQRYEQIAKWATDFVTEGDQVFIEDYSMGSTGKVFHIAENTAILKYLLYRKGINYITVPPTVIKKFYSGKGNATKDKMYDAFVRNTGIDLKVIVGNTGKLASPVTDIIDAFSIGLYGYDYIRKQQD
jgi:hypothetical protein